MRIRICLLTLVLVFATSDMVRAGEMGMSSGCLAILTEMSEAVLGFSNELTLTTAELGWNEDVLSVYVGHCPIIESHGRVILSRIQAFTSRCGEFSSYTDSSTEATILKMKEETIPGAFKTCATLRRAGESQ